MSTRAERLVQALPDGIDLMLVTHGTNVRYLTGYTGSNGLALVGAARRTFVTDFRYVEQAAAEVEPSFDRVRAQQDLLDAVDEQLPTGELRIGFEDAHVSVRDHGRLREKLPERVELVPAGNLIERLRVIKDADEVEKIRASSLLADDAFNALIAEGLAGRSEREVAISLEQHMRLRGASGPSFPSIVASGPHGALPHAQPRDVMIARDLLVTIDWGAVLDGYCSDCTRTVATGDPGEVPREAYELVLRAQLAGLEAVRAGANGREVDGVARGVIADAGRGEEFGHGLGHGVGLDIHEGPRLSVRSEDTLAAGNVVSVEPGVYVPGAYGIRIEDLVVVTGSGCDILTTIDKALTVVG